MELDDRVVNRALGGDRAAFQELVQKTWGMVYVFIRQRIGDGHLSRDVTQETFLQAFDKRATLRQGRSFVSWLLTIAAHKVIDCRRRRRIRHEVRIDELSLATADPRESPIRQAERREERQVIQDAVAQLDDRYRAVLILRYWSGLTPGQIARLLGEPEGTIRNRIFRAHVRLRGILEGGHAPPPRPTQSEPACLPTRNQDLNP